jgi:hypothetical protein
LGINNDPAAVWRNFKTFFTFEEQSICRYGSGIQPALKRVAAEWVYLAQVTGIDKHSSFTIVLIMDQIDQLPGGTPVKIPFWLNVKVAVTLFELDLKIGAHVLCPQNIFATKTPRKMNKFILYACGCVAFFSVLFGLGPRSQSPHRMCDGLFIKIRIRSRRLRIRPAAPSEPMGENLLDLLSDGISDSQAGSTIDQAAAFEFKVVTEIRRTRY